MVLRGVIVSTECPDSAFGLLSEKWCPKSGYRVVICQDIEQWDCAIISPEVRLAIVCNRCAADGGRAFLESGARSGVPMLYVDIGGHGRRYLSAPDLLACGVTQFIRRPFLESAVVERATALLEAEASRSEKLRLGPLVIDPVRRELSDGCRAVHLAPANVRVGVVLFAGGGAPAGCPVGNWRTAVSRFGACLRELGYPDVVVGGAIDARAVSRIREAKTIRESGVRWTVQSAMEADRPAGITKR